MHNYHLSTEEFNQIYNTIKTLDLDRTQKIKGLSSGRADIFPTALAVVKEVIDYVGLNEIIVSGCGLREGASPLCRAQHQRETVVGYSGTQHSDAHALFRREHFPCGTCV